jgi:hypothetical protein
MWVFVFYNAALPCTSALIPCIVAARSLFSVVVINCSPNTIARYAPVAAVVVVAVVAVVVVVVVVVGWSCHELYSLAHHSTP